MSTFIEYTVEQNATFKAQLQLKDDDGRGINLASYLLTSQVRRSYSSLNVAANVVCTMVDASNGVVQLSMSYLTTANIKAGRYVYDVIALNNVTDEELRFVEGVMTVTPCVTR
jgi:hypothetical protein